MITPLTTKCAEPLISREHICIGISPFNSLFSEAYISGLIKYGLENFKSFHLFLPDEPTFYTLEALGHNAVECRRKMKKQLNWLRNKIQKALDANHLQAKNSLTLDWQSLTANPHFNQELDKVYGLFDSSESFRNECLLASRWVLQNRLEEKEITKDKLLKAVKYFLSEIPLFTSTNTIVGSKTSLFCYHQSINFHQKLYNHQLPLLPQEGQGFGVINS